MPPDRKLSAPFGPPYGGSRGSSLVPIPGFRVLSFHRLEGGATGQVLHGSATTTEAVRRAIQHSQERPRSLANRCVINSRTVAKSKKRTFVVDLPTGPREPTSTVLSIEEEAVVVTFRQHSTPFRRRSRTWRARLCTSAAPWH